jgi:anaerobic magnesium-protoporphyrin IX monomethyl ester cyclase
MSKSPIEAIRQAQAMTFPSQETAENSSRQKIGLVTLHAGYSHSSLALQSIRAFCVNEPFYDGMKTFETLVNVNHQSLLESLVTFSPVLVGFSTYLWNIQASLRLAAVLKQLLPDCRIVLGGPEAGPRAEALLRRHTAVDFIVEGEGEAAFRDLARWCFYGEGERSRISGLHYRHGGEYLANPVLPLDVEEIASTLTAEGARFDKPLVYWETSRGCPFRCSFCTSATDRLRVFPISRIESDLRVLEGLENKTVKLLDRSFHLGKARTLQLLQRFTETPPALRFHLELNPDRISDEAMAIFRRAEAGKFQFEIGLQTLQEPVLNAIDRQMAIPKALDNIRQLVGMHRHPVHLDLIVGLPGEDAAQCADSLDRVFPLYADHLQLGTLKLLPGTPLLEQAGSLGYRWDREPPYEVLAHPLLSFSQIARFKRYAELLERLWNSGYLRATLAGLVASCFAGRLSSCFDAMLQEAGEGLASENLQPDSLLGRITDFVIRRLPQQPALAEWLLWDYCHYSLLSSKTPAWIADVLERGERISVDGTRRRLPVVVLSQTGVELINRLTGEKRQAGRYALWPRQHKKGKPVEVFALDERDGQSQLTELAI